MKRIKNFEQYNESLNEFFQNVFNRSSRTKTKTKTNSKESDVNDEPDDTTDNTSTTNSTNTIDDDREQRYKFALDRVESFTNYLKREKILDKFIKNIVKFNPRYGRYSLKWALYSLIRNLEMWENDYIRKAFPIEKTPEGKDFWEQYAEKWKADLEWDQIKAMNRSAKKNKTGIYQKKG